MPDYRDTYGWGCKGQQECNMYKNMYVYRTKWLLPEGFKCEHCKLQWVSNLGGSGGWRGLA